MILHIFKELGLSARRKSSTSFTPHHKLRHRRIITSSQLFTNRIEVGKTFLELWATITISISNRWYHRSWALTTAPPAVVSFVKTVLRVITNVYLEHQIKNFWVQAGDQVFGCGFQYWQYHHWLVSWQVSRDSGVSTTPLSFAYSLDKIYRYRSQYTYPRI